MNIIKSAVTGLILGALLALGLNYALSPPTEDRIYLSIGAHTFKMLNPDNLESGGTGFSVKARSGKTYTLTNAHVCKMTNQSYIVAEQEGKQYRLPIITISERADLCILQSTPGATGLNVASDVRMYDHVYIVGHPWLNPLTLTSGNINDVGYAEVSYCNSYTNRGNEFFTMQLDIIAQLECTKRMFATYTSAVSAPGNSGSAVVNPSGDVVGVLFAGNQKGISLVVPLEDLKEFLADF